MAQLRSNKRSKTRKDGLSLVFHYALDLLGNVREPERYRKPFIQEILLQPGFPSRGRGRSLCRREIGRHFVATLLLHMKSSCQPVMKTFKEGKTAAY